MNFIFENTKKNLFDSSATANQIINKINTLRVIKLMWDHWQKVGCTIVIKLFCSMWILKLSLQCELTLVLNEYFLLVENNDKFKNIDENDHYFDDNKDVCNDI